MGGTESKDGKHGVVKHELMFSEEERNKIQYIFCTISHGHKSFTKEQFQHFTQPVLNNFTSSRMYDLLERPLPHHHGKPHLPHFHHAGHSAQPSAIHLQEFASHMAMLLKGGVSELTHACMFLASTSPASVAASEFVQFVGSIIHSYERILSAHCAAYQSWIFSSSAPSSSADTHRYEMLACSLLSHLLKSTGELTVGPGEKAEKSSTLSLWPDQVEEWLNQCVVFRQMFRQVLQGAVQFHLCEPQHISFEPQLPQVRDTNWSKFRTILDFNSVLFINTALPDELRCQWNLVYSDAVHGHSFSRFLQSLTSTTQPTILVIRDRDKRVFGGFASQPWEVGPKFSGNHQCFLFEIGKSFSIYKPTGYNNNYMYLNVHQQMLPNGLGMGGQFEHFGLWIDASFDHGHSRAGLKGCTTYGSPQLSGKADFSLDVVELWAVGRKKKKDGEEDEDDDFGNEAKGGKNSILDRVHTADKALLDLVDRGTVSDHLREEPIEQEATEADKKIISLY